MQPREDATPPPFGVPSADHHQARARAAKASVKPTRRRRVDIDTTADARAAMRQFGRMLASERELRQIPLAEVAAETRIPRRTLELLESGAWKELPARVFVRGFVRSYARCVGLPEDDTVARYLEIVRSMEREIAEAPGEPVGDAASEVKARRRFGLALFVIIVLIIATITLSLLWRKAGPVDIQASDDPAGAPIASALHGAHDSSAHTPLGA